MPPKKAKAKPKDKVVKDAKSSKRGDKGVKINIVIDQSKKSKGVAPKAPTGMRTLPAFSAMPQGPSFLGASYPTRQDPPISSSQIDYNLLGNQVYKYLLAQSNASGFQTAGQQLNQIFDGQFRAGRNNVPIISEPKNDYSDDVDEAISENNESDNYRNYENQIVSFGSSSNRGSKLPSTNENSLVYLNADERRDNDLDNLVSQERKSGGKSRLVISDEDVVNDALDDELGEENDDNEEYVVKEVTSPRGQQERAKELSLESDEAQYRGRNVTPNMKAEIYKLYDLPPQPPAKGGSLSGLRDYLSKLNEAFGTNYETDYKGRRAETDLRRAIRIAFLKEYDDISTRPI